MREAWTDERLDDLNITVREIRSDVRAEFHELRAEMGALRTEMHEMRRELNARIDSFQRTMSIGFISMSAAIVAGFGAIATRI